jgi:hypothetical protein
MKLRLTALAMALALLGAFVLAPLTTRAADTATPLNPVSVTGSNNSGNKAFTGTWTPSQIVEQGGALFAEGVLAGEVTKKNGKVTPVEETVLLPVAVTADPTALAGVRAQATTCEVLHLVLGPITLNLLGLNLFIGAEDGGPIVVDITADPSGGLLGQLLCGLAGGAPLPGLAQLTQFLQALNALLGLLG